jgi:Protein of unknown function (DUF2628)
MPAFAVLEPPGFHDTAIEHADRFVFLHEKFGRGAFLFGPLWMIWRRLWVELLVYLAAMALIAYALRALGVGGLTIVVVFGLIHLFLGLEATTLVRWARVRRGWRDCGVVIADDLDMAERRFFDSRVALRAAARPAPMATPGPLRAGPSSPDIIGLFPEPGGGR